MSEKLCLQWNDFKDNIKSAFGNLREDKEFSDVTLACEDGQQVEVHKVILAASSPFFRTLLGRNKHSHPLIYMRGVKSDDLLTIMDFLYRGEANVCQENLDSFLAIAEELQLKGFTGKIYNKIEDFNAEEKCLPLKPQNVINTNTKDTNPSIKRHMSKVHCPEENISLAIPGIFEELEERVKSLMEKSQKNIESRNERAHICKVCGKGGAANAIKDHIEANHLDGIVIPCNHCNMTFSSRNALRLHGYRKHPGLIQ